MSIFLAIPAFIWLIASVILFAFGEFLSKKFALEPSVKAVIYVWILYSFGTFAWLPAILQKNQLSVTGAIWSVMSLMATVLIGILLFGEKLTAVGMAGIFFAIISITLLSL